MASNRTRTTTGSKTTGASTVGTTKVYDSAESQRNRDLKSELQKKEDKIYQLSTEFNKLIARLSDEQAEKMKILHEHQLMVSEVRQRSGKQLDQTLKDENDRLKSQINTLNIENSDLRCEIDRLRTSLSKIAGEKMMEDNPFVTDLSDPNRPQRLAEKYNSLYDNSWTDAFEVLSKKDIGEEVICKQLINIFKECWSYCSQLSKHQMSSMQQMVFLPDMKTQTIMMHYPCYPPESLKCDIYHPLMKDYKIPMPEDIPVSNTKLLRDARRSYTRQFIPVLCNYYWDNIVSADVTKELQIKTFVNDCLELCWYSAITDPPLFYTFTAEVVEDFRGYTNKGDEVDYVVWPAMYLHEFGPILYQGVVQFKQGNKKSK